MGLISSLILRRDGARLLNNQVDSNFENLNNAAALVAADFYGDVDPTTIEGITVGPGFKWAHAAAGVNKVRNAPNNAWITTSPLFMDQTTRQVTFFGNAVWICPIGVYIVWATGIAGGGGGGGGAGSTSSGGTDVGGPGGGGGAGQACIDVPIAVIPGTNYSVVIGGGGSGGSGGSGGAGGTPGGSGGTGGGTSFDSTTLTLLGGGGATGGVQAPNEASSGAPGSGYPSGSYGSATVLNSSVSGSSGVGASSAFGGGGGMRPSGSGSVLAGAPAGNYGAGGSGAGGLRSPLGIGGAAGGAGSPGFLVLRW